MKNLPDKIYLNFGEITKEEFEESDYKEFCKIDEYAVTYCEDKVYDCDVEYVRTDAFIEKAEKWLNEYILDYVYAKEWGQGVGVEGELFNDFKEYMKGE